MRRLWLLFLLLPTSLYAQGAGTPPYRGVNNWSLIFGTDNVFDIGANAAQRPRTGYFGTSVITPALTVSGLTPTRLPFAGTGGAISDDADLTFATDTLTATKLAVTTGPLTTGTITCGGATSALSFGDADSGICNAGAAGTNVGIQINGSELFRCTTGSICQFSSSFLNLTSGQARMVAGVFTAGTMTAASTVEMRTVTSAYTWANAQVAALGATTAGDITVATLPAKTQVVDAMVVITGAASGPTTVTVSCGDAIAGTPFINYVVASDAKAAANTVYGDALAERGTSIDTEFFYLPSYTATTLVTCHFISTGANLSTVTGSTGRVILTTRLLP